MTTTRNNGKCRSFLSTSCILGILSLFTLVITGHHSSILLSTLAVCQQQSEWSESFFVRPQEEGAKVAGAIGLATDLKLLQNQTILLQRQYLARFATVPTVTNSRTISNWNFTTGFNRRRPRRKVILIGPQDRFNFGDLLFERVVSKLLTDVKGYSYEEDILVTGMIDANMTEFGGSPRVVSLPRAIQESQQEVEKSLTNGGRGPYNVVFLGGQASNTNVGGGASMFPTKELRELALGNGVTSCAYLFPKEMLLPEKYRNDSNFYKSNNIAEPVTVVNSMNMVSTENNCSLAIEQADYVAFRDLDPSKAGAKKVQERLPLAQSRPDCAVMTNFLFHDLLTDHGSQGEVAEVKRLFPKGYIAVQLNIHIEKKSSKAQMAKVFDRISEQTGLAIVIFRAATIPWHDSLEMLQGIQSLMKNNKKTSHVFLTAHLWSIIALIRYSSGVISTSLHVRIMAFVHAKPRVSFCGQKYSAFLNIWEAQNCKTCIKEFDETETAILTALQTSPDQTYEAQRHAIQSYMEGFQQWASLLDN